MADVLLLLVGEVSPGRLHEAVAAHGPAPVRVHVVAPALVGALDWLATAEDEARRRAEVQALTVEWSLADAADVGGEAGEADPVQAVADALGGFPADEILIAGDAADAGLEEALAAFRLPVRRLEPAPPPRSRAYRALRRLAAGRDASTPFVLFVGVNGALLLLSALLSALVLLILWLAGEL